MTALILQRARLLIANPDNWIKGKLHDPDETCFCAMGALCHTRDRLPDLRVSTQAFNAAESLLNKQAIRRAGDNYVPYNDLESTTHADILSLFDDAIAAAEAEAKQQAAASTLPVATEPEPAIKPFDLEDCLVEVRPMVEPTPAIEPLPIVEQLRSLDEALKELQAAQGARLNADSYLRNAEAQDFSVSVTTDPAQWRAARDAIQKRMDDLMPKFKAGDRVRLINSKHPDNIGALLTIIGPVEGLPGWYSTISDKPLMSASCLIGRFGESFDERDERLSTEADVFCTRIEKVESVEDLITELVTDVTVSLQVCRGSKTWIVSLPANSNYVEARDPDLLSALARLRDKVKESNK